VGEAAAAGAWAEFESGSGKAVDVAQRCKAVLAPILAALGEAAKPFLVEGIHLAAVGGSGPWSMGDAPAAVAGVLREAFECLF